MPTVVHPDPFNAVLLNSPTHDISIEQAMYIRKVLDVCCSDSRFAEKAWLALVRILSGGAPDSIPFISSLSPNTVVLGSPSFDIHVMGSGFTPASIIVFNGFDEPTTFVSPTELTTGINMDVWAAPVVVPVGVRNDDGILSDPQNFEFTAVAALAASAPVAKATTPVKK